ncbi:hypothetical protein KCP75_00160 [Salmonella enterica subsp. enterica]|nr:hypothetical protein KCP75_00160 [Salmonella enterica subsp. enterica]
MSNDGKAADCAALRLARRPGAGDAENQRYGAPRLTLRWRTVKDFVLQGYQFNVKTVAAACVGRGCGASPARGCVRSVTQTPSASLQEESAEAGLLRQRPESKWVGDIAYRFAHLGGAGSGRGYRSVWSPVSHWLVGILADVASSLPMRCTDGAVAANIENVITVHTDRAVSTFQQYQNAAPSKENMSARRFPLLRQCLWKLLPYSEGGMYPTEKDLSAGNNTGQQCLVQWS